MPSYSAKINDFLRYNDVHSKHKRITKKTFPRRRIISRFPFEILQADLIQYSKKSYTIPNRFYKYILVVIDCFTKFVWAVPMKDKGAKWTSDAFESILGSMPDVPVHLITDRGTGMF